jgi:hypothetical protein
MESQLATPVSLARGVPLGCRLRQLGLWMTIRETSSAPTQAYDRLIARRSRRLTSLPGRMVPRAKVSHSL